MQGAQARAEEANKRTERRHAAEILLQRRRSRRTLDNYAMARGFWPARHHRLITEKLEAVANGTCKRLIVIAWPGAAKSTYVSQLFTPYLLTKKCWTGMPWDILATSHNQDLADDFSYKVRQHVRDDPKLLKYDLETEGLKTWRTTKGDTYRAFGITAGITGRRFDVGIGDDWVKSKEAADSDLEMLKLWKAYLGDFRFRAKPDGAIIIVMTHWTELDPIGRILPQTWNGESGKIVARDGEVWDVIRLAALHDGKDGDPLGRTVIDESGWPEWQPTESFQQIRTTLITGGEGRTWTACFQGVPSPEQGTFFKREKFQYFDEEPVGCRYMVTSDFAASEEETADHIVHGLWAIDSTAKLYLLEVWRKQATLEDDGIEAALDMCVRAQRLGDLASWVNEKGVILKALGGAIRTKMQKRPLYCQQDNYARSVDKRAFAGSIKSLYNGGGVYHRRNAPWLIDYENELLKFLGGGTADDQVDMAALAGKHVHAVIAPPLTVAEMVQAGQPGDDRLW